MTENQKQCEFWFKFYIKKQIAEVVVKTSKGIANVMKFPAPINLGMAYAVQQTGADLVFRLNLLLAQGPCCRPLQKGERVVMPRVNQPMEFLK